MSTQPSGSEPNVVVIKQSGGWFGRILVFIGLVGVLFAAWLGLAAVNLLPSFIKNPFQTQTTEHNAPVLVEQITDAHEFLAAKGSFQVVVDNDTYLTVLGIDLGALSSCRQVYVMYGDVDATVDVSGLTEDAIVISPDGKEVTITLPEPKLSDVHPNLQESYQLKDDRGLFQWIKDAIPFVSDGCPGEQDLLKAGQGKIAQVADQSDLKNRAEANTRAWLEGMLHTLGYERVTINFAPNPQ